ncbi:MAG: RHS repeat-associated core domain-containing protein, partial [Chthoniobacterales bacterium]
DAAGNKLASSVYGIGIDEIIARFNNGATQFLQQDRLGNISAVTDPDGVVLEQYRYDAFGQPEFHGPPIAGNPGGALLTGGTLVNNRFLFTGREWVARYGFYEYRNRAYNPTLGRFMSEDPKGFAAGDRNLFRYCGGDPVNRTDPMGEYYESVETGHNAYTIRIPIHYTGVAATTEVIRQFHEGIASLSGRYSLPNGQKVSLIFQPVAVGSKLGHVNHVDVRSGAGEGNFGNERGSNEGGTWYAGGARNLFDVKTITPQQGARHSVGHFFGWPDEYSPHTGKTKPGSEGNVMDYHPDGVPNAGQIESLVHPTIGRWIANQTGWLGRGNFSGRPAYGQLSSLASTGGGGWETAGYFPGGGEEGEGFHPVTPDKN